MTDGRSWIDGQNIPGVISNFYQNVLPPAGSTAQWTFVVPAGSYAILEEVVAMVNRFTAGGAAGSGIARVVFIPGNGQPPVAFRTGIIQSNNVGDKDGTGTAANLLMQAGDSIQAQTFDNSAGGTILFTLGFIARVYAL